jgi:hypothetical protein
MRICEIEDGIFLRPGRARLDEKTRFHGNVIDICGPILEERPGRTVDVVHFSAKEYAHP